MDRRPPFFAVLRHSERMDMVEGGKAKDEPWEDRASRPWDPPITDCDLPRRVVDSLSLAAYKITKIYSSPFRRCLQTAAITAKSLGLDQITVHPGVGEVMSRARQCCCDSSTESNYSSHDEYLLSQEQCASTVENASQGNVTLQCPSVSGEIPPWNETLSQSMVRLGRTLTELQEKHASLSQSVLIVTHGDALQAASQAFLGQTSTVYDLDFCALMVFDSDCELVLKHGLQMLEL